MIAIGCPKKSVFLGGFNFGPKNSVKFQVVLILDKRTVFLTKTISGWSSCPAFLQTKNFVFQNQTNGR